MFNRNVVHRIVFAAVLAGLLSGFLLTAMQKWQISDLILQAEVYEQAAEQAARQTAASTAHSHEHGHDEWRPANGNERTFYTLLANISLAVAFALLLAAGYCLCGQKLNWRQGLLWGLAGYLSFFAAPAIGLPPELPGGVAAALDERQFWWWLTAISTASALALLAFGKGWMLRVAALLLLMFPFLIGAPEPSLPHATASAPAHLTQSFIQASALSNAVFWLALGALSAFFYQRLQPAQTAAA